jgi:hypothetical protein
MSNDDDTDKLSESNDAFTISPYALSPTQSNFQEFDPNRSMPAAILKSPVKKMGLRRLQDIDPNLSGSIDFSGESKIKIPHHRVDDLSQFEDAYEIGKKLGE